jgi:hypothetical protein
VLNSTRSTPVTRLLLVLALTAAPASAHQASVVYLDIEPDGRDVDVTFQVSNLDLAPMLELRERAVAKNEVDRARVVAYLAQHVSVDNAGFACAPHDNGFELLDRADGFFAVAHLRWSCKRTLSDGKLRYDLFFDLDPRHQGLARVSGAQHVFRADNRELSLTHPVTLYDHVRDYLVLGIEHIFTGYDHLAFLFGLLAVAGFTRLRDGLRYLLGVVTAFTVAHSLTLISAGLGWLRLPSSYVEPAIALSIAYVAVENLLVAEPRHRWRQTFAFGLVHGLGFASVLRDVGLPPRGLVLSLLSFNLGVEAGQLAVVSLVAPALYLFTHWNDPGSRTRSVAGVAALAAMAIALLSRFELPLPSLCAVALGAPLVIMVLLPRLGYQRTIRVGGSLVLLALSSLWFFERILQRSWLGGWLG